MKDKTKIAPYARLLRELAELAEHASLTGSLSDGENRAAERYNSVLSYFATEGLVPEGIFTRLAPGCSYGDIGVEARMLLAYVEGQEKASAPKTEQVFDQGVLVRLAPFVDSGDLGRLVREHMKHNAHFDMNLLTSLAPFLDSGIMGEVIRDQLAQMANPAPAPAPAPAPEPPAAPAAPAPVVNAIMHFSAPESSREIVPAEEEDEDPDSLEALAARLRQPNISNEERQEIAIKLAQIAHEQARASI